MFQPLSKDNPLFKRMIFLLCIMSALTQVGLVLYTPAFIQISQAFQIDPALVKITLTAYLLGFSISQLIYGPLSDRIGRKTMVVGGLTIFTLACLWSAMTHSYQHFMIARVIQGIGAGSCMTMSRAILRDSFEGKNYIYGASFLSAGFALGLGVSPVIGGHLLDFFSWRSEFVFLTILGLVLTVTFQWLLPETYNKEEPKASTQMFVKKTLQNYGNICKNQLFLLYLLGGVMAYGIIVTYTTMGPFLFVQTLHLSASSYGWLTFFVAVAYYASTYSNRKLMHHFEPLQIIAGGLILIAIAALLMLIPAWLFHTMNIYLIAIPLLIAAYGQAFVWSNTFALALRDLGHIAGTASGLFNFLQMALSSIISAILATFSDHTQIPMGLTIFILGLLSAAIFYGIAKLERRLSNEPSHI